LSIDEFNRFRQTLNCKSNKLSEFRTFSGKKYPFDLFESITNAAEETQQQIKPPSALNTANKFQFTANNSPSSKMSSQNHSESNNYNLRQSQSRDQYQPQQNFNNYNNEQQNGVFAKPQLPKANSLTSNLNYNSNGNNFSTNTNNNNNNYNNNSSQQQAPASKCISNIKTNFLTEFYIKTVYLII
jgi:hypothetical protein